MSFLNRVFRNSGPVSVTLAVIISVFLVVAVVEAVTTISLDITTEGTLSVTGATVADSGLVSIGTISPVSQIDVTSNSGRVAGLQINLVNSGSGVTGFRGIDSRVTDNGTAAYTVGVQGLLTKATGVSTAEGWAGNFVLTMTGGTYEDVWGVVGSVTVGATASVGTASSPAVNNLVAGRFESYVDTSATLGAVVIDSPILSIIQGGANNRAKADAAVMAMIQAGTGTVTAESAFAVRDYGDAGATDEFDYGLNLYFNSGPFANTFAVADIKLQNGETISNSINDVIKGSGVFIGKIGDVASASAVGVDGYSVINITGNTTVTSLTGGTAGQIVTFICNTDSVTFTDDDDALDIAGDFVCGDNDVLQVVLDASAKWHEISRTTDS